MPFPFQLINISLFSLSVFADTVTQEFHSHDDDDDIIIFLVKWGDTHPRGEQTRERARKTNIL